MSPIDRLTSEKRKEIESVLANKFRDAWREPTHVWHRGQASAVMDAIESVIAATSEPATIKAGDEVFPGGVALPADAIDALSFQKFQPKRISDLMQQTRDHRAWVEADKAIAIDESRMSELTALREKLADEKKLHDQTRGWLRDEKAKVATSERELAELRAAVDKYGLGVQFSVAVGVFPTFSAACLAAYHAENAEVPNG